MFQGFKFQENTIEPVHYPTTNQGKDLLEVSQS